MSVFRQLDPLLQAFLADEGFERPTAAQEAAIPAIMRGEHTLLIAPTGMGKTESAVLPVFSGLMRLKRALPPKAPRRIRALYVTPLRALNRDLMERLHGWGKALGLDVRVRHGDTPQSERTRQSKHPPDLLITTPETLQVMFMGKRLRDALAGVKIVIVDEVHELAEDERGAQLAVALERLEDLVEAAGAVPFQRVGLSATVGDPEEIGKFLAGGRPVTILKIPVAKRLTLSVASPKPREKDRATAHKLSCRPDAAAYLNACLGMIEEATATILFVNTRETAEVLAARIRMLDEDYPVAVHHGSLARDIRVAAEEAFREGRVRALIATSSMELGIDVGAADLVIQYGSPRQVTRLVQRVGRAGHRHDLVSNGVVVAQDADDLFEAFVIARRTLGEKVERPVGPRAPLDVLANQLAAMALERGRVRAREAFETFRRAHAFADLTEDDFEGTLAQLAEQRVVWRDGAELGALRRTRTYMTENISMIRDERTFRVVNLVTRRPIATLDEGFVAGFLEPSAAFIAQGHAWRVVEVDDEKDEIRVEPVKDPLGAIPSWIGEEIPVPLDVARDVADLRGAVAAALREGGEEDAVALLTTDGLVDRDGAEKMVAYVRAQGELAVPTADAVVIELATAVCVLHVCRGSKVNETLGRLLAALLTTRLGESVGLQVDPYRVILTLPRRVPREIVEETLRSVDPEHLAALLEMLLASSHYIRRHMLGVARKFGALARHVDHKKVNVARLLDLYKNTPLHREAMREVMTDKLDVPATAALLRDVREGRVRVVTQALSAMGKAGLENRVELISPARADATLLHALKQRLENERVVLLCMNKRDWKAETRVHRGDAIRKCPKCGSVLLGVVRPWHEESIKAWRKKAGHTAEDRAALDGLATTANLYLDHGELALLALVARGVGPDTAARIIAKQKESEDEFLRSILEAEVTYARTRQFWD